MKLRQVRSRVVLCELSYVPMPLSKVPYMCCLSLWDLGTVTRPRTTVPTMNYYSSDLYLIAMNDGVHRTSSL